MLADFVGGVDRVWVCRYASVDACCTGVTVLLCRN
jgi:hypothetical protein